MTFMHEGGAAMWAMGVVALGSGAWAIFRRDPARARQGALACLVLGLLGLSGGLTNTAMAAQRAAPGDQATVLSIGIDESVNNTFFGAGATLALGLLSLGLGRRRVEA